MQVRMEKFAGISMKHAYMGISFHVSKQAGKQKMAREFPIETA